MLTPFDPERVFEFYETTRGVIVPPGGGEGVVIIRERGTDEEVVALGKVGGQYLLTFSKDYHPELTPAWEVTPDLYIHLCSLIDQPEFLKMNGISGADVLDGESYLISRFTASGITHTMLGNPRECDDRLINAFADALDRFFTDAYACRE